MSAEKGAVRSSERSHTASSKRGYERDNGPLSTSQMQQIKKLASHGKKLAVRYSLVKMGNSNDSIS